MLTHAGTDRKRYTSLDWEKLMVASPIRTPSRVFQSLLGRARASLVDSEAVPDGSLAMSAAVGGGRCAA